MLVHPSPICGPSWLALMVSVAELQPRARLPPTEMKQAACRIRWVVNVSSNSGWGGTMINTRGTWMTSSHGAVIIEAMSSTPIPTCRWGPKLGMRFCWVRAPSHKCMFHCPSTCCNDLPVWYGLCVICHFYVRYKYGWLIMKQEVCWSRASQYHTELCANDLAVTAHDAVLISVQYYLWQKRSDLLHRQVYSSKKHNYVFRSIRFQPVCVCQLFWCIISHVVRPLETETNLSAGPRRCFFNWA